VKTTWSQGLEDHSSPIPERQIQDRNSAATSFGEMEEVEDVEPLPETLEPIASFGIRSQPDTVHSLKRDSPETSSHYVSIMPRGTPVRTRSSIRTLSPVQDASPSSLHNSEFKDKEEEAIHVIAGVDDNDRSGSQILLKPLFSEALKVISTSHCTK